MNRDEYVETVKLMMEKQDMYLMWFLGLLGIILVFVGILQWRLSSKQISQVKAEAIREARKEIMVGLKEIYQVDFVPSLRELILSNEKEISKIRFELNINSINQRGSFEAEVMYLLSKLSASEKDIEKELFFFVSKHFNFLVSNEACIYSFSKKLGESDIISKINPSDDHWKAFEQYVKSFREGCNDNSLFNELNEVIGED